MSTCTVISRVTAEASGWVIGFRVWDLRAFDQYNNCVVKVDRDMGDNRVKFRSFIEEVADAGYCLTPDQVSYIHGQLLLDLPQFNNRIARIFTINVTRVAANAVVNQIPLGSIIAGQVLGAAPADIAEKILHELGI